MKHLFVVLTFIFLPRTYLEMTQQMDGLSINSDLILNELKHMRTGIDKLDKRMEKSRIQHERCYCSVKQD